ncbi:MAG: cyanophycinase [Bacteroidetes bacterium]|nr:MAG: cyanophycinase [Bacteroidota bacterium]
MSPAQTKKGASRGFIIPIGGAEEKDENPVILEKFIEICGGNDARIVVIPTASRLRHTGSHYEEVFDELGAADVRSITVSSREDCEKDRVLKKIENATGVFITGGNQLRLSTIMGGTSLAKLLRKRNANGLHIGGTSAGAAIMPEHMIAGGETGPTPFKGQAILAPGLGLTNAVMIDQHFRERGRLGRLLSALAFNPFATGLGIDEDTAAFIGPDGVFEVVGSGAITVVDPANLKYSSIGEARRGEPVSLINVRLHILTSGSRFDTKTREPIIEFENAIFENA